MTGDTKRNTAAPHAEPVPEAAPARPPLTPAAERALAEAAERRANAEKSASQPNELGGRAGPDPVRYGDWENGGIISDF